MAGGHEANQQPSPGRVPVIDGYRDLRLVGSGGFSNVYTALQDRFSRTVAVKVITVELSDSARRRFEREQAATGQLDGHPHVIRVYESGLTADGQPYLTMEYHEQGSVADLLQRQGRLPVRDVVAMGVKLACALEAAHRRGIVHRDVKPQNVLLSPYTGPVLADFGIAGFDDARINTVTGEAFSALHVAPEVLEGHPATPASDLYSLGSSMYEMLAGRAPYGDGDTGLLSLMRRIRTEPLPPIQRDDVSLDLTAALTGFLARDPADRPASALAMAEQLRALESTLGFEPTPLVLAGLSSAAGFADAEPDPDETIIPGAPLLDPPGPSLGAQRASHGSVAGATGTAPAAGGSATSAETPAGSAQLAASSPRQPTPTSPPPGRTPPGPGEPDAPPGDTGPRVTDTISRPVALDRPEPLIEEEATRSRVWLFVALGLAGLAVLLGVVLFLVLRDDGEQATPSSTTEPQDPLPECPGSPPAEVPSQQFDRGEPPTSLDIEQSLDGTSATLTWDDPNDGGNFYVVFASCDAPENEPENLQIVDIIAPGDPPEATIEDLSLDFNYCFTVGVLRSEGGADMYEARDGTQFVCVDGSRR